MGKKELAIEEGLFYISDPPEKKPYLIGSKCKLCGAATFPKIPVCGHCGKKDTMEELLLDGKGTIDTFSIVNSALPGFKAPSIQAYINLEAGPRVWGLIMPSEQEPEIGMEVELVIAKVKEDAEGNDVVSYQFRPLRGADRGGQS